MAREINLTEDEKEFMNLIHKAASHLSKETKYSEISDFLTACHYGLRTPEFETIRKIINYTNPLRLLLKF